ncbi:MAG: aspartate aminotransferase family protein [Myxococcales bacterium]|nr:aspartate aminotransferase family protein [Myxococcales bacterium]
MDNKSDPSTLETYGQVVLTWISRYLREVEGRPIRSDVAPGTILEQLPPRAPEKPESYEEIIGDLDRIIAPGLTHWHSPGWFAYFPSNTSVPSILADLAAAGMGQQGMLWATSPACTELEMVMLNWLVELLDLPRDWRTDGTGGGVIQTTASDATHLALVVARQKARVRTSIEKMVVYASNQAHSSIEKGARIAGYEHIRLIDVDETFAMCSRALRTAIMADKASGLLPVFVNATVGSTGTAALDPLLEIGKIASEYKMWFHVDAAYAGTAMMCPEYRRYQEGVEYADSYVFNPHKWMGVGFDCSCFYVKDRKPLIDTLGIVPSYLRSDANRAETVVDYRDWQVALGRRFRALKIWFVLRAHGAEALRAMVRRHVSLARAFGDWVDGHPCLVRIAPVSLALVSFRHVDGNNATQLLVDTINASEHSFVTPATLKGEAYIRVSIGQMGTQAEHVERLKSLIDGSLYSRNHSG